MNKKTELGQFFTTNSKYILKNMITDMPVNTCENVFVDPFAGERDLLKWLTMACRRKYMPTEAYDIDPVDEEVKFRDSFLTPPSFCGKYIITNPPYLAKNKTKNKVVFDAYDTNDLYKAAIKMFMGWDIETRVYDDNKNCKGGIVIVPLNFFCDRDWKLRKDFLSRYKIICLNVFEEKVFKDTSYTVCAFNFREFRHPTEKQKFRIRFYPDYNTNSDFKKDKRECHLRCILNEDNKYTLGYNFIKLTKDRSEKIKVGRLVGYKELEEGWCISKLSLRAIDTGSNDGRIKLTIRESPFYGKVSDRSLATIIFSKEIEIEKQEIIAVKFNEILEDNRDKYHSLFLTNFRNSTVNYSRKRIDFRMAFGLISHIVKKMGFE